MIGYSALTQKGQVTIPVAIREALGLTTGQKVVIYKDLDGARIQPVADFFALKGSVRATKPANQREMREQFAQYLAVRKQK